jgi:hypothetical protein
MQWWNDVLAWFGSSEGWRILSGAVLPFLAIVIAGIVAALIARGALKRGIAHQNRELQAAAVGAMIHAGRSGSRWASLSQGAQDHADAEFHIADVRLRLLPLTGASAAADWAAHELQSMRRDSAGFSFQADQTYNEYRDRLLEWQRHPGRARKLFALDLERFRFEDQAADAELVERQQQWAATEVAAAGGTAPAAVAEPVPASTTEVVADAVADPAPEIVLEPAPEVILGSGPDVVVEPAPSAGSTSEPVDAYRSPEPSSAVVPVAPAPVGSAEPAPVAPPVHTEPDAPAFLTAPAPRFESAPSPATPVAATPSETGGWDTPTQAYDFTPPALVEPAAPEPRSFDDEQRNEDDPVSTPVDTIDGAGEMDAERNPDEDDVEVFLEESGEQHRTL